MHDMHVRHDLNIIFPSLYLSADEEKEKKSQTVIFVMALYPLLSLRISMNP
jgi:hypothetical protein